MDIGRREVWRGQNMRLAADTVNVLAKSASTSHVLRNKACRAFALNKE